MDFSRSEALLGAEGLRRLAAARILIVGVGGVGSWCAEALLRTGAHNLTLMDDDVVQPSNVNRQCPATSETIGQLKVEALRARLLMINPTARIMALPMRYPVVDHSFDLASFDLIVDAIDSVSSKAELILSATRLKVKIVSSMGAALRMDPTQVVIRRFDKVTGDGLARALRQRFKRLGEFPTQPFTCVASTEPPRQSQLRGSLMPVTCAFGMALAAESFRLLGSEF